jgi:hypothetical protein
MKVSIASPYPPEEARRRILKSFKHSLPPHWPNWPLISGEREMKVRVDGDRVLVAYQGSMDRYAVPRGSQTRRHFEGRVVSSGVGSVLEGDIVYPTRRSAGIWVVIGVVLGIITWLASGSLPAGAGFGAFFVVSYLWWGLSMRGREFGDDPQAEVQAIVDRLTGALEPDAGSPEDPRAADRLKWGS